MKNPSPLADHGAEAIRDATGGRTIPLPEQLRRWQYTFRASWPPARQARSRGTAFDESGRSSADKAAAASLNAATFKRETFQGHRIFTGEGQARLTGLRWLHRPTHPLPTPGSDCRHRLPTRRLTRPAPAMPWPGRINSVSGSGVKPPGPERQPRALRVAIEMISECAVLCRCRRRVKTDPLAGAWVPVVVATPP